MITNLYSVPSQSDLFKFFSSSELPVVSIRTKHYEHEHSVEFFVSVTKVLGRFSEFESVLVNYVFGVKLPKTQVFQSKTYDNLDLTEEILKKQLEDVEAKALEFCFHQDKDSSIKHYVVVVHNSKNDTDICLLCNNCLVSIVDSYRYNDPFYCLVNSHLHSHELKTAKYWYDLYKNVTVDGLPFIPKIEEFEDKQDDKNE